MGSEFDDVPDMPNANTVLNVSPTKISKPKTDNHLGKLAANFLHPNVSVSVIGKWDVRSPGRARLPPSRSSNLSVISNQTIKSTIQPTKGLAYIRRCHRRAKPLMARHAVVVMKINTIFDGRLVKAE